MILTTDEYFAKHLQGHEAELTDEIRANANTTVDRWNDLLAQFYAENSDVPPGSIASGWRPAAVNSATPGAAAGSKHMTGTALDFTIPMIVRLFVWLLSMPESDLAKFSLWFEDFRATPTWVHGQIVPPHSGNRFFIPDINWATRLAGHPLTVDSIGGANA